MAQAKKKLVVTLDAPSPKKTVVRFDGSDNEEILKTIYVGKGVEDLAGYDGKIKVTIEAA